MSTVPVDGLTHIGAKTSQGSKFHLSDRLRQVEYLQDLSDGRLCCIGFLYFRQVKGTFGQVIFTIHSPNGQVHSIWNFETCIYSNIDNQDNFLFYVYIYIYVIGIQRVETSEDSPENHKPPLPCQYGHDLSPGLHMGSHSVCMITKEIQCQYTELLNIIILAAIFFHVSFEAYKVMASLVLLRHLHLVPHICVSELGQHWFR